MPAAVHLPGPHRFSRREYERMVDGGIFLDQRVELLEGVIISMSPQRPPHAAALTRVARVLERILPANLVIRSQSPIVLDDWSEPEPDVAVCRPEPDDYAFMHPSAADVMLVVEVADSSLAYDLQKKAPAYAGSGIRELWVLDLSSRELTLFTRPLRRRRRYSVRRQLSAGDAVGGLAGGAITVADLLPPASRGG